MLNPKEISDKRFDKSTFGYRTEDVDVFLKEVAISYANILKDNEQTEIKILKLVEKINEYRDDEDAIKTAIISAQKQGKQTIIEAESLAEKLLIDATAQSEKILSNATFQAEKVLIETRQKYSEEIQKLDTLKKEITAFKAKLSELYNKQLRLIMEIPDFDEDEDVVEDEVAELKVAELIVDDIIKENNEGTAAQASPISSEEQNSNFPYSKESYNSNQSRFSDLKFGNNQNK